MKKQTAVFLTALLAASSAFAMPVFNAKDNTETSNKIEAVLQQKQEAKQAQEYVKVLEGVLISGSFSDQDIPASVYKGEGFRVEFAIKAKANSSFGDIMFSLYAPANTNPSVKISKKYTYGVSNDPHAPIDILLTVKVNGKEKTFAGATVEALDLAEFVDCDYPRSSLPIQGTVGSCPKCGAEDPYHCGKGHIGPCSQDKPAAKPQKPTQEVIWERRHSAECNDEYHCHCPSAVSEITGIAVVGSTTTATKTFDGGTFTANIFATKDGNIAYSVKPVKDAELSVSVVTDPKTNADPHQYLDINLVVKEKDAKGNVKKTTQIFIMSADATTL